MKFVDFHNHLYDLAKFESISKYKNGDIFFVSTAGNEEELSFLLDLKYGRSWENIAICAAVHPVDAESSFDFVYDAAEKGLLDGIGETGLDYRNEHLGFKDLQKEMFKQHIKIAGNFSLPLVVHSVKAMEDLFKFMPVMKQLRAVIFHSWSGSYNDALFFLRNRINALFSFNQQSFNRRLSEDVIKNINIDSILLETDFPWHSLKGEKYTSPFKIEQNYMKISDIKGINLLKIESNMLELLKKIFFCNNFLTTAL